MARKKKSKVQRKVRALKNFDPRDSVPDQNVEDEWAQYEPEDLKDAPHTFIIHRGKIGTSLKELLRDIRLIMEPYTATKLKARKGNVLRDYVSVASYFHVTHMCVLSRTKVSPYIKICKVPRGPTLTFKIVNYALARDCLASLRKQVTYDTQFEHCPLLILNEFTEGIKHLDLISTTFQSMFPTVDINNVRLKSIRRVLLLNYHKEDDTIELRHYTVTYRPQGISRPLKKILAGSHNKIPNLGRCLDVADFLDKAGEVSESEGEDNSETVDVSQSSRGKKSVDEVAVRLVELGPRLKLQLIKVEEGLCDGDVLYHKFEEKTSEDKLKLRKEKAANRALKIARRKEQDKNVEMKRQEREAHKKRCLAGMRITKEDADDDDDADWYRKEVGVEPDEDAFLGSQQNMGKFMKGGRGMISDGGEERGIRRKYSAAADQTAFDGQQMSKRKRPMNQGQSGGGSRGPKVSKFAKVKEKAKLMKKNKKEPKRTGGKNFGAGTIKRKGSGFYSKPSRAKMTKKKM